MPSKNPVLVGSVRWLCRRTLPTTENFWGGCAAPKPPPRKSCYLCVGFALRGKTIHKECEILCARLVHNRLDLRCHIIQKCLIGLGLARPQWLG